MPTNSRTVGAFGPGAGGRRPAVVASALPQLVCKRPPAGNTGAEVCEISKPFPETSHNITANQAGSPTAFQATIQFFAEMFRR
jgi:hypothetical protein